jgi:predicted nucleic acid-binding protein
MNVVYEGDFFLDSNIWLYALSQAADNSAAEAKRKSAIELTQRSGIVISFQVINEVCVNAAQLRTRYQCSFWDSLIVAAAIQSGVTALYSEDMQSGLNISNQLEIINPFL